MAVADWAEALGAGAVARRLQSRRDELRGRLRRLGDRLAEAPVVLARAESAPRPPRATELMVEIDYLKDLVAELRRQRDQLEAQVAAQRQQLGQALEEQARLWRVVDRLEQQAPLQPALDEVREQLHRLRPAVELLVPALESFSRDYEIVAEPAGGEAPPERAAAERAAAEPRVLPDPETRGEAGPPASGWRRLLGL